MPYSLGMGAFIGGYRILPGLTCTHACNGGRVLTWIEGNNPLTFPQKMFGQFISTETTYYIDRATRQLFHL
jgi:hypothetical protein